MDLGHKLRGATLERVSAPAEPSSVLIVGAGPSGLAAAWRLERFGIRDYRILDLERLVGGTSAAGYEGAAAHPWGAHYVPMPGPEQPELLMLLEEVGAVIRGPNGFEPDERARVRAPEERLFIDGRWVEGLFPATRATAADRAELSRFEAEVRRWSDFRDDGGRRAFALPMRRCSDAAEVVALDRISAGAWLDERGFRSKLLRWYVEYACRDDYGAALARTSAWAMLFYFCARATSGAGDTAPFLTWPEGNGRLVRHLSRNLGDRLRLGCLVTDVVPAADGVDIVAYDANTERALRYRAEDVIVAAPKFVARRIVRPLRELPADGAFHYAPWLVANVHLKQRPKSEGFPFAWDNVLFDSPALGYVVATHQTLSDFGPTVWTYYRPFWEREAVEARGLLAELDHASAVDAILLDLGRAHHGLEALVERIDVYRWGHGMVTPVPGFIWGAARARANENLPRVAFAHSDGSGLALLEEAVDRGLMAADAVLRRRGINSAAKG
jgi:protoporphyrinogen oxidase